MNVCLLSLSLPYFHEDQGCFLFCLPLARNRQQVIEGIGVRLEGLVGFLQALLFYQVRKVKDNVVTCWEAGLLAEGTTVKENSCVQCGSQSLHYLFLLMKLIWVALVTCKDVIEGRCLIWGLEWLTFQIYSVILLFCRLWHCFPYEYVLCTFEKNFYPSWQVR